MFALPLIRQSGSGFLQLYICIFFFTKILKLICFVASDEKTIALLSNSVSVASKKTFKIIS